jgi:DNA-binding LytR/AlgR family response regulator
MLAIAMLEGILKKIPYIEVVKTFNDALSVYDFLNENVVDFLFLDIEMPNLTGIDFLRSLTHPPLVIITSANKNYALEGFELNVVDYVLKPLTLERVTKSLCKVVDAKSLREVATHSLPDSSEHIFLKENKRNVRVNISEILYLESVKDYVKVVTKDKTIVTKENLSHFEKILNSTNFVRIHRSFIVAVNHVDAFSCSAVEIGKLEIPIGRLYKESSLKHFGDASVIE